MICIYLAVQENPELLLANCNLVPIDQPSPSFPPSNLPQLLVTTSLLLAFVVFLPLPHTMLRSGNIEPVGGVLFSFFLLRSVNVICD